jgi:hypothetical protein
MIHFRHSDFLKVTHDVLPNYGIDHIHLSDLFPYTGEGVIFIGIYTMLISSTFLSTTKYYPVLIDYSTKFSKEIIQATADVLILDSKKISQKFFYQTSLNIF